MWSKDYVFVDATDDEFIRLHHIYAEAESVMNGALWLRRCNAIWVAMALLTVGLRQGGEPVSAQHDGDDLLVLSRGGDHRAVVQLRNRRAPDTHHAGVWVLLLDVVCVPELIEQLGRV